MVWPRLVWSNRQKRQINGNSKGFVDGWEQDKLASSWLEF